MKKLGVFLAVVGSLIGVGIILSFYGNYLLFEGLVQGTDQISFDKDLIIEAEIDSSKTQTGIFAVQKIESQSTIINAHILDPSNSSIESQSISGEVYEGLFDVTTTGTYKLVIENSGEPMAVFGVIGPEPDSDKKILANISLYILVVGVVGMAGVAVYIIINRKKSSS